MRVTSCHLWLSIFRGGLPWLGAVAVCLFAGCWQEVEYNEPATTASSPKPETEATDSAAPIAERDDGAEEFADDLASSLADKPLAVERETGADATNGATTAESAPPVDVADTDDMTDSDSLFGDLPVDEEPAADTEAPTATASDPLFEPAPSTSATVPESATGTRPYDPLFDDPTEPATPETDRARSGDTTIAPVDETATLPTHDLTSPTDAAATDLTKSSADDKARRAAWLLGGKLSLAALSHGKGASGDDVQKLMDQSRSLARLFGMTVPDLPARAIGSETDEVPEKALDYLFKEGNQIGTELARRQGVESAALFEVAVKSNILLVLYRPGSPAVDAISTAISQAGGRANLPSELWQPLVDLLARQAPVAEVRAGVYRMHADADRYFAGDPSQQ